MVAGTAALIGISAAAGKTALQKVATQLYDAISDRSKKALQKLKNDTEIAKLSTQLSKVRKVKTLGQLDKAVDLATFYCDSHVWIRDKRTRILNLHDFGTNENLLIEGIAGQGKSIFLRYLCSMEAATGSFIPIFAELRRIQKDQTLRSFIIETLRQYNIKAEGEIFDDLVATGKVILLLDAFDEVLEPIKERILSEIEQLAATHDQLRIVVTSRPESGIAVCPTFNVVKLSDLQNGEYKKVVQKVCGDAELAKALIQKVQGHKGGIKDLLHTPLLVTLLVIRFKSFQELPEQLSDFYDSLFEVLLQRHDGIKPGYHRARACSINDYECREAFEAFCFISKRLRDGQLKYVSVYAAAKSALEDRSFEDDPQNFISDIVKITCLLVKDGEEYRFIHKSVQEYYAASYIMRKPDKVLEKLYPRLFDWEECWHFQQELRFLEEIDSYRFAKYGTLSYLKNLFQLTEADFSESPKPKHVDVVKDRILCTNVALYKQDNIYSPTSISMPDLSVFAIRTNVPVSQHVYNAMFSHPPDHNALSSTRGETISTTLAEAIPLLHSEARSELKIDLAAQEVTEHLFSIARIALKTVAQAEDFDPVKALGLNI